jgi:hypothetical protein
MRRIALLTLLVLGLPAVALFTNIGIADAHRGQAINAEFIARLHERHGHHQFRGGDGTPGHTWQSYRREARRLRAYLRQVELNRQRQALVARWQGVADCEAGGNWHINTGNGHYGGLQFSMSTWSNYGGSGMPNDAPAWRQAEIGERVRNDSGLGAWPHCGQYYG